MPSKRNPTVFLSSTLEDLKPFRQAAIDAAVSVGFRLQATEYFGATTRPTVDESIARVTEADVLIVIVGHRYGWVPGGRAQGQTKSVTWLECEHAVKRGIEVLAFVVDEDAKWPAELQESFRLAEALNKGDFKPNLVEEVQRNATELKKFKLWLKSQGVFGTFSNPEDLGAKVTTALRDWRERHSIPFTPNDNPGRYLDDLRDRTAWIDIRALRVSAQAYRLPIGDLYIPLDAQISPSDGLVGDRQ